MRYWISGTLRHGCSSILRDKKATVESVYTVQDLCHEYFLPASLDLDLILVRELTGNFCYINHSLAQTHIRTHLFLALSIFGTHYT